jgi:hypothetical protein
MKSVPFGPVRVKSDADVQKLLGGLKAPRGGKALKHITVTIVPADDKPSKKPTVAFHYLWGDWTGISFWG